MSTTTKKKNMSTSAEQEARDEARRALMESMDRRQ